MNRVSLFIKGVWFSENVCEGSPTQILIHCSSKLLIHLTEPFGWKTLLKYTLFPFWGRGSACWDLRTKDDVMGPFETRKIHKSLWNPAIVCRHLGCPAEGIFVHLEKPLHFLLQPGTQRQLLMTQNVTEWMVGIILQKSFSDAPNDTRTILERLPRKLFSLFRNVYFSLKARELPLVKMAAQRQLPTSS